MKPSQPRRVKKWFFYLCSEESHYKVLLLWVKKSTYLSLLQLSWRSLQFKTLCCFVSVLCRGCDVFLSIMCNNFCSILLSTTNSRGFRVVPSTACLFLIRLLSLLVSLALILLPLLPCSDAQPQAVQTWAYVRGSPYSRRWWCCHPRWFPRWPANLNRSNHRAIFNFASTETEALMEHLTVFFTDTELLMLCHHNVSGFSEYTFDIGYLFMYKDVLLHLFIVLVNLNSSEIFLTPVIVALIKVLSLLVSLRLSNLSLFEMGTI